MKKIQRPRLLTKTRHDISQPSKKAWNSGKKVGQKKPLTPHQAQKIRKHLKQKKNLRNQVLFSLGYDSALRSSDIRSLTIGDVLHRNGTVKTEFIIGQTKTSNGVRCVIAKATRKLLARWIRENGGRWNDPLFPGRTKAGTLGLKQHQKLVKDWVASIGLNPEEYSSHTMRRTRASIVYAKSKNLEYVRQILGQKTLAAAAYYLGVSNQEALDFSRKIRLLPSFGEAVLDFFGKHFWHSRYTKQFSVLPAGVTCR